MTKVRNYIDRFNKINGKPVERKALQAFLASLPKDPALDPLREKLKTAISKIRTKAIVKFTPLSYSASPGKIEGVDRQLLVGLEQIQKDDKIREKGLDGLSDTTYKVITDRILELMKADGLIWRKPWNENAAGPTNLAHNYQSKHVYRGINYYLNFLEKYSVPYFFTFNQVTKYGGKVKKGEKGWPIVYFKMLYSSVKEGKLVPEREAVDDNGKVKSGYKEIPALFYYLVWNFEQTEGIKIKPVPKEKMTHKEIIASAEKIIHEMPKQPDLTNGPEAWYDPSKDLVQVPKLGHFKVDQQYYSVFFHELVHSTGHRSRVGRELSGRFGSKAYAFEELIAELGASFLCGESGILYFTMKNSAAYIKSWSKKLTEEMMADPKFFLRAAAAAQKAADFMLTRGEYAKLKKKKKALRPREPVKRDKGNKAPAAPAVKAPTVKKKASVPALNGSRYYRIELDEQYARDFPKLYSDAQIMYYGLPGSGKTVDLMLFAKYLAGNLNKKVLYVAAEEYGRSTFDEKISEFNVRHPNLIFVKSFAQMEREGYKLDDFGAVFFDSVDKLKMAVDDWTEFADKHPNMIKVAIKQTTKEGDFRGGQEWSHEMDIVVEIRNRRRIVRKNRLDPDFSKKRDALLLEDEIQEKEKNWKVREQVKSRLAPRQDPRYALATYKPDTIV